MSGHRILVAIADYGGRPTLRRVRACFDALYAQVVVFSTVSGDYTFAPNIGEDLPFANRQMFVDEVDNYDYFIYTENDILYPHSAIKQVLSNLETFGPYNPIGMIRHEQDQLIDFAASHPNPKIKSRAEHCFTPHNDHQGSYFLTQRQLKRAIDSGNFLIKACERSGYGRLETGATNVYVDCGLQKVYPKQNLETLLVEHLDLKWKLLQHPYTISDLYQEI